MEKAGKLKLKHLFFAAAILFVLMIGFGSWQLFSSKLTIISGSEVAIHTLYFGEYASSVKELIIYETEKEVMRLTAKNDNSQMHTVSIHKGTNEFRDMYLDGYIITYPLGQPYAFKPSIPYKVIVQFEYHGSEGSFILQ